MPALLPTRYGAHGIFDLGFDGAYDQKLKVVCGLLFASVSILRCAAPIEEFGLRAHPSFLMFWLEFFPRLRRMSVK